MRTTPTTCGAFLSTLSLRRATRKPSQLQLQPTRFLSTLSLRRATLGLPGWLRVLEYFYPRSPCGERLLSLLSRAVRINFYPRSPCGERRFSISAHCFDGGISIHALLAESDCTIINPEIKIATISIHALLAESDKIPLHCFPTIKTFLSTLSLRRATYFSGVMRQNAGISIHALLAESD